MYIRYLNITSTNRNCELLHRSSNRYTYVYLHTYSLYVCSILQMPRKVFLMLPFPCIARIDRIYGTLNKYKSEYAAYIRYTLWMGVTLTDKPNCWLYIPITLSHTPFPFPYILTLRLRTSICCIYIVRPFEEYIYSSETTSHNLP